MTGQTHTEPALFKSELRGYFRPRSLLEGPCLSICTTTAVLLILVNFAAGLVAGAINIPGASGLVTGLTVPFFLTMLCLTTKRFGAVTICWTIYSTISIPMYLMGPPNVFKPLFGLAIGLAFEIPILLLRQTALSFYLGLLSYTAAIVGMAYVAFALLHLPGADNAFKFIWVIAVVFLAEGCLAVFLARRAYPKAVRGSRIDRFFSR